MSCFHFVIAVCTQAVPVLHSSQLKGTWSKKARRALASVAVRSSSPAREFDPRDNLWEINTLNSERTLLLRVPRKWSLHALFSVY